MICAEMPRQAMKRQRGSTRPSALVVALALCAMSAGCGSGGPASPSAVPAAPSIPEPFSFRIYDGEWSGITGQGTPITFVVSGAAITSLTIGYSFNGCSGTTRLSDLAAAITDLPSLPGRGVGMVRIEDGPAGGPDATAIQLTFRPPLAGAAMAASGPIAFINYTGCGNAGAQWTATRR